MSPLVHGLAGVVWYASPAYLPILKVLSLRNRAVNMDAYDLSYYSKSVTDVPVKSRPSDQKNWPASGVPGGTFSARR